MGEYAGFDYEDVIGGTLSRFQHLGRKTFGQATLQIVLAVVSMSLDNVLAIAGVAREHPIVLLSVCSCPLRAEPNCWPSIVAAFRRHWSNRSKRRVPLSRWQLCARPHGHLFPFSATLK